MASTASGRVGARTGQRSREHKMRALDAIGWAAIIIVFGGMAVTPFLPCI
jgi:hypothetical protein